MEKRGPSLEDIKKFIRCEGRLGINCGARLPSLKLPRDLSLREKKPKKVYIPNLNVVRNKDKPKIPIPRVDRRQKRPNRELRRQPKETRKIKYMEGVFSQGIRESTKAAGNRYVERASRTRDSDNAKLHVSPKINHNSGISNGIAPIYNYDADDNTSGSDTDGDYDPVVLPLSRNKDGFACTFKRKTDYSKVKDEMDVDNVYMNGLDTGLDTKVDLGTIKTDVKHEDILQSSRLAFIDSSNQCDEESPVFSLIRLPDSFPGKVYKDEGEEKSKDFTAKAMHEGQIGKLVVRKSGKIEAVIKNTKYVLNVEYAKGCSEDVVMFPGPHSIAMEPSLVSIGPVEEKFTLSPDWSNLFTKAKQITNGYYW